MKEKFTREEVLQVIRLIIEMPEELREAFIDGNATGLLEESENYLFE